MRKFLISLSKVVWYGFLLENEKIADDQHYKVGLALFIVMIIAITICLTFLIIDIILKNKEKKHGTSNEN